MKDLREKIKEKTGGPPGKGKVRFPEFIAQLKTIGFDGELIIEREIAEGAEQNRDISETVENLRRWWAA